jgi:hypothetical protein
MSDEYDEKGYDKKFLEKNKVKSLADLEKQTVGLDAIETGLLSLDMAIGYEGPSGRVGIRERDFWEILSFPGSGKTCIAEEATKTVIKTFGPHSVVWLFGEPFEASRMRDKNVNLDDIIGISCFDQDSDGLLDPSKNLAESKLDEVLMFAEQPRTRLIIIDTVASLMVASQLYAKGSTYRDLNVTPPAALAKVLNNFIGHWLKRNKRSAMILLNQYKEPINTGYGYTNPNLSSPGGRDKESYGYGRVLLRGAIKKDESAHSELETKQSRKLSTNFELIRNKYCNPTNNRTGSFVYDFAKTFRFNNEETAIERASFFGARVDDPKAKGKKITVSEIDPPVATSGAWIYIGDESFNGMSNAVQYLVDNPGIYDKIKKQLYKRRDAFYSDNKPTTEELLDGASKDQDKHS